MRKAKRDPTHHHQRNAKFLPDHGTGDGQNLPVHVGDHVGGDGQAEDDVAYVRGALASGCGGPGIALR